MTAPQDRQLEAVAANIVHQIGDALYEALPADVAHKHFVNARQATNDRAIDFAKELITSYVKNVVAGSISPNMGRSTSCGHDDESGQITVQDGKIQT